MGKIALEGMTFYANHGYYTDERKRGKNYIVDIYVQTEIDSAGASDDLDDTINYEVIYKICQKEMNEARHLIETVARSIALAVKDAYPKIEHLSVKVRKLSPELGGPVANAHVIYEI